MVTCCRVSHSMQRKGLVPKSCPVALSPACLVQHHNTFHLLLGAATAACLSNASITRHMQAGLAQLSQHAAQFAISSRCLVPAATSRQAGTRPAAAAGPNKQAPEMKKVGNHAAVTPAGATGSKMECSGGSG